MQLEGTWGINFPLIINDLRLQKTTSSKEVAQCQAQALQNVWFGHRPQAGNTPPFQKKPDTAASGPGLAESCNPTLPSQGLVWRGIFVMSHASGEWDSATAVQPAKTRWF